MKSKLPKIGSKDWVWERDGNEYNLKTYIGLYEIKCSDQDAQIIYTNDNNQEIGQFNLFRFANPPNYNNNIGFHLSKEQKKKAIRWLKSLCEWDAKRIEKENFKLQTQNLHSYLDSK